MTFGNYEGLQAALRMEGREVEGRALSVALAHQEVLEGQCEAFVLNIPLSADKEALEKFFTVCGAIKSLRLPLDKDTNQLRVRPPVLQMCCKADTRSKHLICQDIV